MLTIVKNKSSKLFFGLFLVYIIFCYTNVYANYLNINNNTLNMQNDITNLIVKKNQTLDISTYDKRIIVLSETNKNKKIDTNYLFYTNEINKTVAYSGKPIEMLISLNKTGIIDDIKLIKHSEPILLTGIPIEKLLETICFYKYRNISKEISIGTYNNDLSIPIISGATVTSLVLHETILDSARTVAKIFKIISNKHIKNNKVNTIFKKLSWTDLINLGAIKHYSLDISHNEQIKSNNLLVDLYFCDIKHPSIGRNLLGDKYYYDMLNDLEINDSVILILNNGIWSFKGSGFVRGGIFDRFRIEQNNNIITFRDNNFKNVYNIESIDINSFKETGIFIIKNPNYDVSEEWNLVLLVNHKTFNVKYNIPKSLYITQKPMWIQNWESKIYNIIILLNIWIFVIIIFIFRAKISKNNFSLSIIYNCFLLLDIFIIGTLFEGQPSITNIITLVNNIKNLSVFLLEPYIFLGWIFIFVTVLIWGKSLFCGWICPFGALQETIFKLKNLIFKNSNSLNFQIFNTLKYLKYIILSILLINNYTNFFHTDILIEIEPFKTVWIIGLFNRSIYPLIYTIFIFIMSIFVYRFFCRFFCPLGAFLSLLSFSVLLKLKRRGTCNICQICKTTCSSNAINKHGQIDSTECFGCFTCINNMYNKNICPPINNKKIRYKYEKNIWW